MDRELSGFTIALTGRSSGGAWIAGIYDTSRKGSTTPLAVAYWLRVVQPSGEAFGIGRVS